MNTITYEDLINEEYSESDYDCDYDYNMNDYSISDEEYITTDYEDPMDIESEEEVNIIDFEKLFITTNKIININYPKIPDTDMIIIDEDVEWVIDIIYIVGLPIEIIEI